MASAPQSSLKAPAAAAAGSQFTLLRQRRFLPFFVTQFLGAFNDNVFKNALVILIAFKTVEMSAEESGLLVNIAAGLFILPFFLFSSTAGQIGDSREKSALIRRIKMAEVCIMLLAAIGFLTHSINLLLAVLFFMGAQSAMFGPVKFGYLPQHLDNSELTGGNGMVEMGTFMAILLGMMLGGFLMTLDNGVYWSSAFVVCIAAAGYLSARGIPATPAAQPGLAINWNVFTQTWRTVRLTMGNKIVFLSILGVSWFWFLGSTYMVQLPNYTRRILGGDETVYILLITMFCIGIGIGSLACEKLSARRVELGLVPLGAAGLSAFGIDLYFSAPTLSAGATALIGIEPFLQAAGGWRCLADIVLIGLFGGFYIVPLVAVIQERAERAILSRVIAGNNILNAMFMVVAAILAGLLLGVFGWSEDEVFLGVAILNAAMAVCMFILAPEFLRRFVGWLGFGRASGEARTNKD